MDNVSKPLAIIVSWGEERSKIRLPIVGNAEVSIGRSENNTISLSADRMISRHHCIIRVMEEDMVLKDLGSQNGTYLNGQRVLIESPLAVPSCLQVGNTRFIVLPPNLEQDEKTLIRQTIYSGEGNILIPPSAAFKKRTESLMVVDIVNSTALLESDEALFIKIVTALGEMLEGELWKGEDPYLQCTGDGFFACFDSADAALETALELGPRLRKLFDVLLQTSVALHRGSTRVTAKGNRAGNDVYAVFSLESLRQKVRKLTQYLISKDALDLVLLTESFLRYIKPASRNETISVGFHPLKGMDEKVEIFQWCPYGAKV